VKRIPIENSNHIISIGHEGDTLEVEFHTLEVWQYRPVSGQQHRELLASKSRGEYFTKFIKNGKTGQKMPASKEAISAAQRISDLTGFHQIEKIAAIIDHEHDTKT
jgi:hypothetical protein